MAQKDHPGKGHQDAASKRQTTSQPGEEQNKQTRRRQLSTTHPHGKQEATT